MASVSYTTCYFQPFKLHTYTLGHIALFEFRNPTRQMLPARRCVHLTPGRHTWLLLIISPQACGVHITHKTPAHQGWLASCMRHSEHSVMRCWETRQLCKQVCKQHVKSRMKVPTAVLLVVLLAPGGHALAMSQCAIMQRLPQPNPQLIYMNNPLIASWLPAHAAQ